jgi:uncharacterized membrane protein YiaA
VTVIDMKRCGGLEGMGAMVHWGLVISTIILGIGLLVGVIGVWGAKGTVMWMMRVAFFVSLFGTFWSIMVRRRDATPSKDADKPPKVS